MFEKKQILQAAAGAAKGRAGTTLLQHAPMYRFFRTP
jgi:hypothetical protein